VCIHKWEVQLFYANGSLHDPYSVPPHPRSMQGMFVRSAPGVVPQGYLGREQAELACSGTTEGKHRFRLCTMAEWEAACQGPDGGFPIYQEQVAELCNTGKFPGDEHLVYRFYRHPKWTYSELTDRRINSVAGGLARTGEYRRCTNGFGVFDMVGNLQEWVADLKVKNGTQMSVIKGDHYMGQGKNYPGCAATNRAHFYIPPESPDYEIDRDWKDYSTGLRCCTDPR
jgi:sulfatase modifying factor 1